MVALVARALEEAEEDETSGDGGVEDSEENERGDHEGESDFLVEIVAQGSEGRSGVVLGAGVDVHDGADQAEDDDFGNGDGPERFGEIGGVAHFGDEAGDGDLTDEGVADVEESAEPADECGASGGDDQNNGVPTGDNGAVCSGVGGDRAVTCRMGFDAGEDRCEEDRNEGKERGESGQLRKRIECPGKRADEGNDSEDGSEADGAQAVVGHCVEIFGTNQDVETLSLVSLTL